MLILLCAFIAAGPVDGYMVRQSWEFSDSAVCGAWQANSHLAEVSCGEGVLKGRTVDWDPFFTCGGLEIPAKASQCVRLRLRASAGGKGQLFWSGQTTGQYGGFDPHKVTDFAVREGGVEDIYLFPCWHKEQMVRQLRLDLYEGASFEIESIAVLDHADGPPREPSLRWDFTSGLEQTGWSSLNGGRILAAPPLDIPVDTIGWVSVEAGASEDTSITLYWSTTEMTGSHGETVRLSGNTTPRFHHIELQGNPHWDGRLVGFYLEVPEPEKVKIGNILLAAEPEGPPDIATAYFGFDQALNRAGRPESLMAQFTNRGAGKAMPGDMRLVLPEGLKVLEGPVYSSTDGLLHGELMEGRWTIEAEQAGDFRVALQDASGTELATAALTFEPPLSVTAGYVPEPRPVKTTHDVLAYYFPGWNNAAKWDCIRNTAPVRRPLLGYYDEGNVACVDWQIKWAVENGISCFLVDWYWCEGRQHLLQWFDAYRAARYRDRLKVALMWANHNPPKTHSRDDWRAVTREWIDKYFTLDTYYHVNGKPAVYIWNAAGIREDLGGSDEVAAAFAESREMARAAGHDGITFIALRHKMTEAEIALLAREGYDGQTSYHEWGDAASMAPAPTQGRYDDMVATVPEAWEKRRALSEPLNYIPVVDTGWDSRPWHGENATAFHGRTVEGFKALLEVAKAYCERHGEREIILGPLNEWGEGSYIEPNLEYGFGMYEAIREVFAKGDPKDWPQNFGPRDAGLGPYEFPPMPAAFQWNFDTGTDGWAAFMCVDQFRAEEGSLCFVTASNDPAVTVSTGGLRAARYGKLRIRMRVAGELPAQANAQLFWTTGGGGTSEAKSLPFVLERDGALHEYTLELAAHPRWRGTITSLRFDPCNFSGAEICIEEIMFNRQ